MIKVSGSSGAASANFSQLCYFLVFAHAFKNMFAFFVHFWQFCSFFNNFELFLPIFCVLIFQAPSFACVFL